MDNIVYFIVLVLMATSIGIVLTIKLQDNLIASQHEGRIFLLGGLLSAASMILFLIISDFDYFNHMYQSSFISICVGIVSALILFFYFAFVQNEPRDDN